MQDARETLVRSLPWIERQVRAAARRHRLNDDDFEDLRSFVLLKLVEGEYRILSRFSGEGSLPGYLRVAIRRLALDYLDHRFGKWRPSASARRYGNAAVHLERLICRDGLSVEEAVSVLALTVGPSWTQERLRELASRLRFRPKPRVEPLSDCDSFQCSDTTDALLLEKEQEPVVQRLRRDLQHAIATLDLKDRQALELRFRQGETGTRLSEKLGCRRRLVYSRLDRCFKIMKRTLRSRGWKGYEVAGLSPELTGEIEIDFEPRGPLC